MKLTYEQELKKSDKVIKDLKKVIKKHNLSLNELKTAFGRMEFLWSTY